MKTCEISTFLLMTILLNLSLHVFGGVPKELRDQVKALASRVKKLERKSAFSAYMNIGSFQPPTNVAAFTVPFNGIDFNLGGDYNDKTSIYTCPVTGVYYFTYNIYSAPIKDRPSRDRTFAQLVIDNKSINQAFCSTDTKDFLTCAATNSVVIRCREGSHVVIKTHGKEIRIYGTKIHDRTSFTGFLLHYG